MPDIDNKLKAALQSMHIETLNAMQQEALSEADSDKDIVLLSPTGTGKTIAFLLPLLKRMCLESMTLQALVLAPSRELAIQINQVFTSMDTTRKSCCTYGGHSMSDETRILQEENPIILIGTPGRVLDHLTKGHIPTDTIRMLVIDEFDKSLELGFQEQMSEIISHLHHLDKRVLASATDAKEIPQFVSLDHSVRINHLIESDEVRSRLTLKQLISPSKDKIDILYQLLCVLGNSSTIVFCNYREAVDRVSELLTKMKFPNDRFHGGMEQIERERSLYKFRNGSTPVLISTDLAARGLDIPEVEHIIHYHLPVNEEAFTHRNGRTARWNTKGDSYLILNAEEKIPEYITDSPEVITLNEQIPRPPKPRWTTIYIGKGKKDKLSKGDIAGFVYKKGKMTKDDLGPIDVKEHCSYVAIRTEKCKQMLQLVQGEKIKGLKTLIEEAK